MHERRIETFELDTPQPYAPIWAWQQRRQHAIADASASHALILLEHEPTITLGRNTDAAHLLHSREHYDAQGIAVVDVERGGDVTYHGPGQCVVYPILSLVAWRLSVGWYLRNLEQVVIDVLNHYGLQGERIEGLTGVWVKGAKVAALGVGIHRWVTMHGLALNIDPDMSHFGLIVPCGIADRPVTSLAMLLGRAPAQDEVRALLREAFATRFEAELLSGDAATIIASNAPPDGSLSQGN